jgi:hypothetical protein
MKTLPIVVKAVKKRRHPDVAKSLVANYPCLVFQFRQNSASIVTAIVKLVQPFINALILILTVC